MDSLSAEAFVVTLNEYQKIYLENKLSDAVNKLVQDFNTDFGYDSLKIRAKSTQGLESLKQFAHELQLKLKGIAEFSPPEITDDMNSFLADTAEGQQKSRIEIISDQLGLLIYAGKIYATQDQFDSFVSKINLEYANKNNDAEKDRIEETKQELEPIEQLKPQESQKPKYVAIRILSHCLKMIFAPFYYPLVLQALQTDFEIKLQDELEVDHEGVAIRKKDSEMSIWFICSRTSSLGSRAFLFDAYTSKIAEDIRKADEKELSSRQNFWWNYQGDNGEMVQYTEHTNLAVEKLYQEFLEKSKTRSKIPPLLIFDNNEEYLIEFDTKDLNQGSQQNIKTEEVRWIKRISECASLPDSTADSSIKELVFKPLKEVFTSYPGSWTDIQTLSYKTSYFNVVSLDLNSPEAADIIVKVKESNLVSVQVTQIDRIQNLTAHHKYIKEKNMVQEKYDQNAQLEQQLFHGTKDTDPNQFIGSEEGLDMRYAHNGIWGKGLYFTESLSYSDCSSFNLPGSENKIRQIFLSKVLTGKIYESEPDGSIQMPPANPDTGLKYDSVKGRDGIHIIYENGRSYPEYLLSYTYDYALTQKTIEENERVGVFNNSYATLLKTGGVEGQRYQSKNTPKEGGTSNRYQPKGPRLFGGSGMGSNGLNWTSFVPNKQEDLFGSKTGFGSQGPSKFAGGGNFFPEGKQSCHNEGGRLFGSINQPAQASNRPSMSDKGVSKGGLFGVSSHSQTSPFGGQSSKSSSGGLFGAPRNDPLNMSSNSTLADSSKVLFGSKSTNNPYKPPKTIEEAKAILRKAGKKDSIKFGDKRVYYEKGLFGPEFRIVDEPPKRKGLFHGPLGK